jgi:hypothetical protein
VIHSRRQPKPRPLTPAKTPTSDVFEAASPRPLDFESSFYDPRVTWDTANPYSSSPQEFTTPKSEADGDTNELKSQLKPNLDAELASHIHHLSPTPHLTLPPVEPSRQLSSSPGPGSSKRTCLDASEIGANEREVQTTPRRRLHPSAGASNRKRLDKNTKKAPQAPMADQRNRRMSQSNTSRMGPPETPGRLVAASPQFFPSLQFSPDLFQTPMSGPTTAPDLPQNRLFWDPNSHSEDHPYQDPFGPPHPDLVSPFTPSPVPSHGFQSTGSVSSAHGYELPGSHKKQALAPPLSPSIDGSGFPAPFTASPRVPVPAPEDPSMFLSSPARRFGPAQHAPGSFSSANRPELQAYHHQIQESKREEELQRTTKATSKRSSLARSTKTMLKRPVSPPSESRPGLKRSATHSGVGDSYPHQRRQSQVSFADSVSVLNDGNRHRGGRSSPLKRGSVNTYQNVDRPQSSGRTSLSFTIDKDGRAKTVVTRIPDRPASRMEMDEGSSGSETDSLDVADFDMARSQNTSFAFPEQEEQHRPIDRLRYESNSHSKSSSYSSTIGSSASATLSSRTSSLFGGARPRSRLPADPYAKSVLDAQTQRSFTALHTQAPNEFDTTLDEEEKGDAQHALRAMLKDRPRPTSTNIAQFPSRQINTHHKFDSSPPIPHNNYGIFNTSPTTVTDPDLATPSTDRGSHASNGSTRCVCNSSSPDGHLMIQW